MSLRDLKIKTNVVKRNLKDEIHYKKEVEQQTAYVDNLKSDDADEYLIRKQIEVLDESKMMLPDCKKRIAKAVEDLKALLDTQNPVFEGSEELKLAQDVLASIDYSA
ncbi:hypothetical protein IWQ61_007803 [Dispira simplex]|nr:hypothetical protein IWQ61_007803 [Dispira simplex]